MSEWKTETRTLVEDRRWLRLTSGGVPVYVPAADVVMVRATGATTADGRPLTHVAMLDGRFASVNQSPEAVMAALGVEVVDVAGGAP